MNINSDLVVESCLDRRGNDRLDIETLRNNLTLWVAL